MMIEYGCYDKHISNKIYNVMRHFYRRNNNFFLLVCAVSFYFFFNITVCCCGYLTFTIVTTLYIYHLDYNENGNEKISEQKIYELNSLKQTINKTSDLWFSLNLAKPLFFSKCYIHISGLILIKLFSIIFKSKWIGRYYFFIMEWILFAVFLLW